MKRILTIALIAFAFAGVAQTVKQDSNGNFYQVVQMNKPDKATGQTYTAADGLVYIVYKSDNNKLYVIRTSKKTGKTYKQYLK